MAFFLEFRRYAETMNEAFMRERPVLPLIVTMSLPMVLSMLVNSLYNIVDSFFRGPDQRGVHDRPLPGLPPFRTWSTR